MSAILDFDNKTHIVGCASPVDSAGAAVSGDIVNVGLNHSVQFIVYLGTITGDVITLTLEECDDVTPSNATAIAFRYRESGATGVSDAFGAVTAAGAGGVAAAASDDDHIFIIEVDGAELTDGFPYARVVATPGGSSSASEICILAILEPRYPQSAAPSAIT